MCGKWMAHEMAKGHELYSGYTLLQMQQGFKSNKKSYRTIFNEAAKTFYSTDTKAVEMPHLKTMLVLQKTDLKCTATGILRYYHIIVKKNKTNFHQ